MKLIQQEEIGLIIYDLDKKNQNFFRDKSRDNLCKHLRTIGVDVSFAERGIPEEKLFNPWHRRSLGVININSDYLISYINIIKRDRGKNTPPRWWYYCNSIKNI